MHRPSSVFQMEIEGGPQKLQLFANSSFHSSWLQRMANEYANALAFSASAGRADSKRKTSYPSTGEESKTASQSRKFRQPLEEERTKTFLWYARLRTYEYQPLVTRIKNLSGSMQTLCVTGFLRSLSKDLFRRSTVLTLSWPGGFIFKSPHCCVSVSVS